MQKTGLKITVLQPQSEVIPGNTIRQHRLSFIYEFVRNNTTFENITNNIPAWSDVDVEKSYVFRKVVILNR